MSRSQRRTPLGSAPDAAIDSARHLTRSGSRDAPAAAGRCRAPCSAGSAGSRIGSTISQHCRLARPTELLVPDLLARYVHDGDCHDVEFVLYLENLTTSPSRTAGAMTCAVQHPSLTETPGVRCTNRNPTHERPVRSVRMYCTRKRGIGAAGALRTGRRICGTCDLQVRGYEAYPPHGSGSGVGERP